jgi:hypothetical protein
VPARKVERTNPDFKVCALCETEKPSKSFHADKRRTDGLYPYCKACRVGVMKAGKAQDADKPLNGCKCGLCLQPIHGHPNRRFCSDYCKNRTASLRKKFNLSPEDYRALLDDCGGDCPICGCRMKIQPIDHNHDTMEVTGIVCTRCNVGLLAYSNHDVAVAKSLVSYLEDPPARRVLGRVTLANPEAFSVAEKKGNMQTIWNKRRR